MVCRGKKYPIHTWTQKSQGAEKVLLYSPSETNPTPQMTTAKDAIDKSSAFDPYHLSAALVVPASSFSLETFSACELHFFSDSIVTLGNFHNTPVEDSRISQGVLKGEPLISWQVEDLDMEKAEEDCKAKLAAERRSSIFECAKETSFIEEKTIFLETGARVINAVIKGVMSPMMKPVGNSCLMLFTSGGAEEVPRVSFLFFCFFLFCFFVVVLVELSPTDFSLVVGCRYIVSLFPSTRPVILYSHFRCCSSLPSLTPPPHLTTTTTNRMLCTTWKLLSPVSLWVMYQTLWHETSRTSSPTRSLVI